MNKKIWLIALPVALVFVAALLWWNPSSSKAPDDAQAPQVAQPATGDEFPLTAEQITNLGAVFAPVQASDVMPIATVPAMLVPPVNARVAVAAQLPGMISRVFVVEGDMVRQGQQLAVVSSRDMVSLGAELSRARARLSVAEANARRLNQLSREGVIAPARAEEAQAELRQAQVDVRENGRLASMAGSASGDGQYILTAPIAGRISAMNVKVGNAVDLTAAPFVIDGAGPLQAQAQVPERLIGVIAKGMKVSAGEGMTGEVIAIGSSLDPENRSATLTVRMDDSAKLVSGQSLTLSIMGPAPAGMISVPAKAITQIAGQDVVFVRTAKGAIARKISVGDGGADANGNKLITAGLKAGESVATSSVSELKVLASETFTTSED